MKKLLGLLQFLFNVKYYQVPHATKLLCLCSCVWVPQYLPVIRFSWHLCMVLLYPHNIKLWIKTISRMCMDTADYHDYAGMWMITMTMQDYEWSLQLLWMERSMMKHKCLMKYWVKASSLFPQKRTPLLRVWEGGCSYKYSTKQNRSEGLRSI